MMTFIRVIAVALALTSSTWCTHPSEGNQYEASEGSPQLIKATDSSKVHLSQQTNKHNNIDLQVNFAEGFIDEKLQKKSKIDKNQIQRKRRSYSPWSGQVVYSVPYQSLNVWKPPVYQLSRPYFIPVYGVQGRLPIYYPPQPLYINTGVPKDNPSKMPFKGPTYLPPVESTTTSSTTMEIKDRFNGGDNYDDRPIWDGNDQRTTQNPTTSIVPTRKPRPQGVPKTPPLIHNPTDPQEFSNSPQSEINNVVTASPPQVTAPQRPYEPSRCVWAIISCCSSSNQISYDCFDQRGCPGAFWDTNPCDSDFARAAIAAALNYYNRK